MKAVLLPVATKAQQPVLGRPWAKLSRFVQWSHEHESQWSRTDTRWPSIPYS